ncbi:MAG: 8-amino-7-oxononanoate synthase [Cyanobacteria bacterium RM1_2_2]|nr:8-amino-7-oxononanoate synthase [Cyanobacteria bacterium RM1_2_2]
MVQKDKFTFVEAALARRTENQQLRSLQPVEPIDAVQVIQHGCRQINFSSNDYLGLAKHPALIAAAQQYTAHYGTSASASRLVTGTYEIHQQLEAKLAAACGQEAALLFSSGFQANSTVLPALLNRHAVVLCDRLVHSSLIQGILASDARLIRYGHGNLRQLEHHLEAVSSASYSRILIVTETVFSMDGDQTDVSALIQLAQRYNAILYLDDAHGLGVLGQGGMGLAAHQSVDLTVGTFGKAFGAFGAFVACSQKLRDYLINCCPGFIYTTALPPAVLGSIDAALSLMPQLEAERQKLMQQAETLRTQLQQMGFDTGASTTQIIPLIVGAEDKTLRLSQWLATQGILATAIRPPTVAPGTARIRLALSACHTPDHLAHLIHSLKTWHG